VGREQVGFVAGGDLQRERVLRGGSFIYFRINARAAFRYFAHPHDRLNGVGFRVVLRRPPSRHGG
jgi:formylglycine-generating enzyme required for sulfatase activity